MASTNGLNAGAGGKKSSTSVFYFYNPTTVAYGKEEFRKTWGDRVLEDDWRILNKNTIVPSSDIDSLVVASNTNNTVKDIYTVNYYTNQLPVTDKAKDSIIGKRNFAYYQLGLIYKQKFKEYPLASKRLEKLLSFKPNERLALPAKYQLYKIYDELGSSKKELIKQNIIKNYPDSRYAEILQNPAASLTFAEGSPKFIYEKLYKQFENQEYDDVAKQLEQYITKFDGDEMLPKYEILKAVIAGKTQGFDAYKKGINYVALNYPNSDEGKAAQKLLKESVGKMSNSEITDNSFGVSYKLVYVFDKNHSNIKTAKESIEKTIKNTYRDYLKVSKDYYNNNKAFVVVHGFITAEVALAFDVFMKEKQKSFRVNKEYITPSTENYRITQLHKKLAEYKASNK